MISFGDVNLVNSLASFCDAGTRDDIAQHDAFGFGLRFEGPTGLIRVDYGLEAGRSPSEGKLHLQLMSSF